MRGIRRILVAIKDPGSRSLPAVQKAAQLARALGAELELFHAIDTVVYATAFGDPSRSIATVQRTTRERYLTKLESLAERLRRQKLKVKVSAEWDFPIYEAVVRRASHMKADLIVAERHAGRNIAPHLLHLTDWELLRLSPVPLLLVKSPRGYRRPVVLAALDPLHAYAKPAALDAEILRMGALVSEALRGPLHALHAYVPLRAAAVPAEAASTRFLERIEGDAYAAAKGDFDRLLRKARIPGARRHLVARHPVDAIPETARKLGSAIVVMGAVSRSGLKRLFIGNTAERVLDQLPCDVLVVKPRKFVSGVLRARRGARVVPSALPVPY
jgi:universal stress protein E